MSETVRRLKSALPAERRFDEDLFDLLSAACKACCTEYTGGNESCPPKTEIAVGG